MWGPGYAGIDINECTDRTAKDTHKIPSIIDYSAFNSDISKMIYAILQNKKASYWGEYNHRYSEINADGIKAVFAISCFRNKSKIMVRLRMGHTQLTYDYILSGVNPFAFFATPASYQ